MPIIRLDDRDDARLVPYSGVTDVQLRDAVGFGHSLFIGESRKVIERALDAGVSLISLFLEERWFDQTMPLIERVLADNPALPVFVVTCERFRAVTGYEVTRGALAAFERPPLQNVADLLADAHRVAVLEDITNYTNVGAAFRSAAALGIDAVLVTPSCHDPLYRRAARVSMGAVFQVPWTRIGKVRDWAAEGVSLLHEKGFKVAALVLSDDALPLHDARLRNCDRLAVVLGTEGDGLSTDTVAACDWAVRIPMDHGVDSLNVAAASAVAFWELRTKWR